MKIVVSLCTPISPAVAVPWLRGSSSIRPYYPNELHLVPGEVGYKVALSLPLIFTLHTYTHTHTQLADQISPSLDIHSYILQIFFAINAICVCLVLRLYPPNILTTNQI